MEYNDLWAQALDTEDDGEYNDLVEEAEALWETREEFQSAYDEAWDNLEQVRRRMEQRTGAAGD